MSSLHDLIWKARRALILIEEDPTLVDYRDLHELVREVADMPVPVASEARRSVTRPAFEAESSEYGTDLDYH